MVTVEPQKKREKQKRSGAAKTKPAASQHFSLLGFLHSIVSSQNTDSNAEINICDNKTVGQEAIKAPQICSLSKTISNQSSNISLHKVQEKEELEKLLIFNLWNP